MKEEVAKEVFGENETFSVDSGVFEENKDSVIDEEKGEYSLKKKTFDDLLIEASLTKDSLVDLVMEISDSGYIEFNKKIFGKIPFRIKSSAMSFTHEYLVYFENTEISTQAMLEYQMNVFSIASVLESYNGEELPFDINDRVKWIENNVSGPIFSRLTKECAKLHSILDILSREEVEAFL